MQLKVLAAEKEAAIKAQRDADDIEIMLSQVDSGILKPSPKTSLIHSRKNSVKSIPDVTLDSPRVSVGNLTPRERTDRKSTRLNSSHALTSRMPSSA